MNANGETGSAWAAPISRRAKGCALTVADTLGVGVVDFVHGHVLCIELVDPGMAFRRRVALEVAYKEHLGGHCVADVRPEGRLRVELKALRPLTTDQDAPVMNALRASGRGVRCSSTAAPPGWRRAGPSGATMTPIRFDLREPVGELGGPGNCSRFAFICVH